MGEVPPVSPGYGAASARLLPGRESGGGRKGFPAARGERARGVRQVVRGHGKIRAGRWGRAGGRDTLRPMRPRPLLWALLALALAGCRSTELYVYNLREVHQPDGTARRVGNVQGTLGYTAGQLLSIGRFGKPGFIEGEDRAIEDPLGVGLENLTALLDDPNDEHARSRGVQMITWLGPVCSYTLSRQRCAEAIGELGPHYGVRGPVPSPEPAAGVEEVQLALEEMVRASGGDLELAALGTSSLTVEEAAEAVRALPLDRDGGRRALLYALLRIRTGIS